MEQVLRVVRRVTADWSEARELASDPEVRRAAELVLHFQERQSAALRQTLALGRAVLAVMEAARGLPVGAAALDAALEEVGPETAQAVLDPWRLRVPEPAEADIASASIELGGQAARLRPLLVEAERGALRADRRLHSLKRAVGRFAAALFRALGPEGSERLRQLLPPEELALIQEALECAAETPRPGVGRRV